MNGMLGYLVPGEFKYDEGTKISANVNAISVGWPTGFERSTVTSQHQSHFRVQKFQFKTVSRILGARYKSAKSTSFTKYLFTHIYLIGY